MKLAASIALAVLLVGTALITPAAAAPFSRRVALEPTVVVTVEGSAWRSLAQAIGVPWPEGAWEVAPLPTPCVGQMYGGAWGQTGSQLLQLQSGGWRRFEPAASGGALPGVLNLSPEGVVIHAEKGERGEAFLFVGSCPRAGMNDVALAGVLDAALKSSADGTPTDFWRSFEAAVAGTATGKTARRALTATQALADKAGLALDDDGNLVAKTSDKGSAAPKGGPGFPPATADQTKTPDGTTEESSEERPQPVTVRATPRNRPPAWLLPVGLVVFLLGFVAVLVVDKKKRAKQAARVRAAKKKREDEAAAAAASIEIMTEDGPPPAAPGAAGDPWAMGEDDLDVFAPRPAPGAAAPGDDPPPPPPPTA